MEKIWRDTFLNHSKSGLYRKKVYEAHKIIDDALKLYSKPYIAFSGGKDSTCVLHLVLRHNPNILCFHWDFGKYYIPRELHNEIIENAKKTGAKNMMIKTSKQYEEQKRKAQNVLGRSLIGYYVPYLKSIGYDCCFLGLRKEESYKRKRKIVANKQTIIKEIYPIQEWTWLDVWAYIISNGLPYLSFYDRYAKALDYKDIRFTTLFDDEFSKLGTSNIDGVLYWKFKNIRD